MTSGEPSPASVSRQRVPTVPTSSEEVGLLPLVVPITLGGMVVVLAATISMGASTPSLPAVVGVLVLLAAAAVADAFPVPVAGVPGGHVSLSAVFIIGATLMYGWSAGVLVALFAHLLPELFRRRPLVRLAYNAAAYTLSAAAAGGALALFPQRDDAGFLLVEVFAAALTFSLANLILVGAVIARWTAERFLPLLARSIRGTALPFLVIACVTLILTVLWHRSPFLTPVLVGPLVVVVLYQRARHTLVEALAAQNERLRELDRMKDEFVATVSHEFRTPLTSILGFLRTLERKDVELVESQRSDFIAIARREAERLTTLVQDLLSVAEVGRDELVLTRSNVDLFQVARERVDAAAPAANAKGIEIGLVADRVPTVSADHVRLAQLLDNLLSNAIKFTPPGGRIQVRVSAGRDSLVFSVADTGVGIPADEREHVFDRFFRTAEARRRAVPGTGLGLTIVKAIVHAHGGKIAVTSAEGAGSKFRVELPLDRQETRPAASSAYRDGDHAVNAALRRDQPTRTRGPAGK